jgi:hypothetical protein
MARVSDCTDRMGQGRYSYDFQFGLAVVLDAERERLFQAGVLFVKRQECLVRPRAPLTLLRREQEFQVG